jgi:argininosuccinate lyase
LNNRILNSVTFNNQTMEQSNNKLWQKNSLPLQAVDSFTVGNDRQFDAMLARYDVLGSLAHVKMLHSVGLLEAAETSTLTEALRGIYHSIEAGTFAIADTAEDVHSHIELLLTQQLGEAGKKIHSARSRNDQVLVDIKLFLRHELQGIVEEVKTLFDLLQTLSEQYKNDLLPGYTHLQLAMPSSFGLWLGAYAESLADDMITLKAAYDISNKNPLGSAAGYGSSFPINRSLTTQLLGFAHLHYNVVYAQMGRGKTERIVAMALANVADTLAKLSMDACLMMNQHFAFISFPDELTTGSSIMPHKKNPDVFELIRAYCNRIKALPNEIMLMTTNLPSGYHRDLQLLKEHLFPAFGQLRQCLQMTGLMLGNMQVKKDLLANEKFKYLFSVEEVNKLVATGMPFRDAYKQVGLSIEDGSYQYSTELHHTHEGSIGNLCNQPIKAQLEAVLASFPFGEVAEAEGKLIG